MEKIIVSLNSYNSIKDNKSVILDLLVIILTKGIIGIILMIMVSSSFEPNSVVKT